MLFYFPNGIPSYLKLQNIVGDKILEARNWNDVKKGLHSFNEPRNVGSLKTLGKKKTK